MTYSLIDDDLGNEAKAELAASSGWGPWRLNRAEWELTIPGVYRVDLNQCLSGAGVADWVFQVAGKSWASATILGGLVRALRDLLKPQKFLLVDGKNRALSVDAIQSVVDQSLASRPELRALII